MNNIYLFICLTGLALTKPVLLQGQQLNKILEAHYLAIGQENIMSMRTIYMEVREVDGFSGGKKYQITKKTPNKIRIEGHWQEQLYVNAFDGVTAWTIAPWTGVHTAQLMTEDEKNSILMSIGIGSPLFSYKGLDNELELIGSENIQGDEHYVIRSTMPSGFQVDYLIDKNDNLIHLARVYNSDGSEQIEREVIFKNYKNMGGFTMPFGFEHRQGRSGSDVIIDHVVFGQGSPNEFFVKPEN